ncbi:hypothetical protein [Paraburkholderia bannensis]|uniref:hypothetical protein n=1 Tax=Paraburkholderia bannensis TaxID=765414 RepID=UPI002ABDB6E2|nr:hypothetical protein [Paraburkholderia bannensis]
MLDEFWGHCRQVKAIRLVLDLGCEADLSCAQTVPAHVHRLHAGKDGRTKQRMVGSRSTQND